MPETTLATTPAMSPSRNRPGSDVKLRDLVTGDADEMASVVEELVHVIRRP